MDLLHFQTCKTWILAFGDVQQYAHPGDKGRNCRLICLIDVSIIAIRVFGGGGGGGVQLEKDKSKTTVGLILCSYRLL